MPRFLPVSLSTLAVLASACGDTHAPANSDDTELPGPQLSVVTFGITRIGTVEESNHAVAINDFGQVAGTATIGTELLAQAFLWTNGTKQWLAGENATIQTVAADVNAFGTVAGRVTEPGAAATWQNGTLSRLSSLFTEGGLLQLPKGALTAIVVGCKGDIAAVQRLVDEHAKGLPVKRAVRVAHRYEVAIKG